MGLRLLQINQSNCGRAELKIDQFYEMTKGRLRGLVGSMLNHRSLSPIFKSWRVSTLTSLHNLLESLSLFSLPRAQKWL